MEKLNVNEVELNGIVYVKKDSVSEKSSNFDVDIKIVVLQRGWVFIGRFVKEDNNCKLINAYNIRVWGTTKGLTELVNGATTSTVLDKCEGIVEFDWLTVICTITVDKTKWSQIV